MLHLVSSCRDQQAEIGEGALRPNGVCKRGYTVLELLLAVAILGVLAAIAIPLYGDYRDKVRVSQAVQDIAHIQTVIDQWALENRYTYPDSLADVGLGSKVDPWNTPYQYTNLSGTKGKGAARKDKNLVPINTDFDLWSNGKDGKSVGPLTAQASRDDIVRANNGRYIGPAADY